MSIKHRPSSTAIVNYFDENEKKKESAQCPSFFLSLSRLVLLRSQIHCLSLLLFRFVDYHHHDPIR